MANFQPLWRFFFVDFVCYHNSTIPKPWFFECHFPEELAVLLLQLCDPHANDTDFLF